MSYYSNTCSAGKENYTISMPSQFNYSFSHGSVNYSMEMDVRPGTYYDFSQGSNGTYVISNSGKPKIINEDADTIRTINPDKVEIIVPKNHMEQRKQEAPIETIVRRFFSPEKHAADLREPSNPIEEIEKAVTQVIDKEHFDMQEELILRRRVKRNI